MEQITFYKYFINLNKCQIVQYKATGIKAGNGLYLADFFKDNKKIGDSKLVRLRTFESVRSFRVYSFNDDYEKYRQILLHKYAEMIEQNKANVQKQEKFLETLKQKMISDL